jgi:hypothetical protein
VAATVFKIIIAAASHLPRRRATAKAESVSETRNKPGLRKISRDFFEKKISAKFSETRDLTV